jgi:hypothetical protein
MVHDTVAGLALEYSDGEIMNHVIAVKHERQCSFTEAVNITLDKINEKDKLIIECIEKIKNDNYLLDEQPMLMEYIKGVEIFAFGGWIEMNRIMNRYKAITDKQKLSKIDWNLLKHNIEKDYKVYSEEDFPQIDTIVGKERAKIYID